MNKLKMFLMAFLLGFAVNGFAQADGLYYLYEVSNKQFLTHGEDWGTRACLDFYGSPVTWNSTEGSLKFKDNNQCLFKTGDNFFYTDNNSTGFKFVETEGGYYLQTADGASYAKLVDGAHLKCLMPTDNVAEAVVWQLKTKAERDAMVTDYVNQNYVNVINAAGLDITANDFLTELAKYTAVDKTSAIGTARFAGNVGDWTYVKVREQGGQPAYGTDFCEIWQGTGRHTKTITGLTPGIYKVTVQGFERASGWAKCNELAAEGLEISTTTFTANGQHVAFKSWFSGKSDEKNPNNTGEAVAKFNEGKYQNEVYAYVGEDGILNLMVDKHAHVGDNWVLFNNFTLTYYEAPAAPAVPVWKDIKVDFTNNQILTEAETNIISVGIKMNEDGTATRVAADDASANAVVSGKWHSKEHGLANFSATVKVDGPVKIGMGSCAWGGNVTVKDENGVEVANAFNTNDGTCWHNSKNVIYTYYKGEAATLTIAGGSYTPYFSVEKIALEDIPTVMKVNYSLGETGAAGILPANFEIDGGKTFAVPANRTLYVEGKTLTGWTDGTNVYTVGQEITAVADTEITLSPVFTENTVILADRKEAVTIVWDFQQKNGAPVVAVQGKTMIWVAQAVVNGQTIDVKMDIDATSGKVANGSWTDWCQINPNTKLTIPAAKDAVIGLESYNATTTTTIAGDVINQETKTPSYTYTGEEATVDIVIGDGSYWRTVSVNLPAVAVEEPEVTEPVVELTHTASSYCETDANTYVSTVDAEKEHVNNSKFSGTWQGAAYADFSIILPAGHAIKSASLAWAGIGSSKDRTTDIMYVNAGEQLDYTALEAGNAKVNLPATYIATVTFKKSATTSFTTDVTDAVKAIIESGQNNVIFKFTNNVGAGDIVGKGAAEKSPVLTIETVSAAEMSTYTVVSVDANANVLKTAVYDAVVGATATASTEDMAAFKNEDSTAKYIYVGGNSEITVAKDSASNVITLNFREAETYRYSVVAVDGEGNQIQTLATNSDFEGEKIYAPYQRYILNYSDSTLYEASATNKEYRKEFTVNENGAKLNITYNPTTIKNVVAYGEGEDVWGLTATTAGNAPVRSSNAAAAYAEEDAELTYLSTGLYKLAVGFANSKSSSEATYHFALDTDSLFALTSTGINMTVVASEEFKVLGGGVPLKVLKGGNDLQAIDFFFVQKTGGVAPVAVANIAEAKAQANGTPIKLTLDSAVVTVQAYAMMGVTTIIEDKTGAIMLSGDMALEGIVEKNRLDGTLYTTFQNEWGSMQLGLSDSTQISSYTSTPMENVTPAEFTYANVKDEANMFRFVKLGACKTVFDEEMWMYYAVSGTDTLAIVDRFNKTLNWETYEQEIPAEVEYMTGVIMFDGEQWVIYPYAYGEDKAIVGVPQAEDIVVNVTEGDIAAAVEAEKAKVSKVGNITVNLTAGAAYTIASAIEAPAGIIINGNGATIDASALGANFIQSAVTEEAKTVDSIAVLNVTVKGLGKALYYSAGKNIAISNFVVDNSVIEMAKDAVVFDFTKGSAAMNFAVKNSTIYAPTATTKSIYSSQGGEKGDAYGATVDTPQTFSFENTTLYNIAYNKNFFTHRSNGQKWMKFVVKNNVIVNSGKANFMTSLNGGQDSPNPIYDADAANSVGTLVDGAYTDLSASQTVQGNAMGTSVVTNPGFKDVAAGDFTVYAGSEQAKQKIGDPRWLVEFDETLTGIDGINAADTLNGAVYTINGIKVREAGETLKGLSKGMYIINGKKYVVK